MTGTAAQNALTLHWSLPPLASDQGAFEVQRKLSGETTWQTIAAAIPANGPLQSVDYALTFGVIHYYRVRYSFGGRSSAGSNIFTVDGSIDSDGDGVSDQNEGDGDTDGDGIPDYLDTDSDNDGVSDAAEAANGTNARAVDTDFDGLSDAEEAAEGTDPLNPDTDGDGVLDGQDGWPLEYYLRTARLPVTRYAVIVCATGGGTGACCLNNRGDVVFVQTTGNATNLYFRSITGSPAELIQNTHWPINAHPGESRNAVGLSDEPQVYGVWSRTEPLTTPVQHYNFSWAPGDSTITYTNDGFSLPGAFPADAAKLLSAGSRFTVAKVAPNGTVFGTGSSGASRYWPGRSAGVTAPGRNNVAIPVYAQTAVPSAEEWLKKAPLYVANMEVTWGSMNWAAGNAIFNDAGDVIFKYQGFTGTGFAPDNPEPAIPEGTYFMDLGGLELPAALPIDSCVAMSNQRHVLTTGGIYAWQDDAYVFTPAWKSVTTPRISNASPLPIVGWLAMNNRLGAVGLRISLTSEYEYVVLINDHDYPLQSLLPRGWQLEGVNAINDEGMILATAKQTINAVGASIPPASQVPCVVLLLPVEIFPDEDMVDVVGDVVPSILGPTGEKHFVSPQLTSAIPNPHVIVKKKGISDAFFTQYCEWGPTGEAVPGDPLKRRVARDNTSRTTDVTVRLKNGGPTLATTKVWIVWANGDFNHKPDHEFVNTGGQSSYSLKDRVGFTFTILPADLFVLGADFPNLKEDHNKDYPVPNGLHVIDNNSAEPAKWSDGVSKQWDVTRQMQITLNNPSHISPGAFNDFPIYPRLYSLRNGANQFNGIILPWPQPEDIAGNDDSYPQNRDENDEPYVPYSGGVGTTPLDHAREQVTSSDKPNINSPASAGMTEGMTFAWKYDFREFVRLQIGKRWYRVSPNVGWYMELKVRYHGNEWIDDGSNHSPTP